jgi:hypothetical protein
LRLKSLAFAVPDDWEAADVVVRLNGSALKAARKLREGRVEITLANAAQLAKGQELQIEIRRD